MAQTTPAFELPEYTDQQRWQRASFHANLFTVVLLRQGAEAGKSAADVGRDLFDLFGPGWTGVTTPQQMAIAMHRNWMAWPGAEIQAALADDGTVTYRANRPYVAAFGDDGMRYDVSVADMETAFGVFHELIAEQQGMEYEQTVDGDRVTATIRKR